MSAGLVSPESGDRKQRPSFALHAAGYLVTVSAGVGLASALQEVALAYATAIAAAAGQLASLLIRRAGRSTRPIELLTLVVCLGVVIRMLASQEPSASLIPSSAAAVPELKLAVMLLWIEVLRSFTLVSDDAVVFSAVPAATLLALAANGNPNADMLAYFLFYLAGTCFLLVHRNALGAQDHQGSGLLLDQLRTALSITLLAVIVGAAISVPLRLVSTEVVAIISPELVRMRSRIMPQMGSDAGEIQIAAGPVNLSERVVMTVRIKADGYGALARQWYWRGKVYDRYTGRGWQNLADETPVFGSEMVDGRYIMNLGQEWSRAARPYMERPRIEGPTMRVHQWITKYGIPNRTLHAAAEPESFILPYDQAFVDQNNCWRSTIFNIAQYEAISRVPDPSPMELERAGTNYPHWVRARFLQRTSGTVRTAELARRITQGLRSPYAKARAIENYLSNHYSYDPSAPAAPRTADAVEYFLFTAGTGYCDVFASAMVVMCREIGIPARLATGYASGVYDPDAEEFKVREADRHAWAEVYFPGYGWITFDPVAPLGTPANGIWQEILRGIRQLGRGLAGNAMTPLAVLALITLVLFCGGGAARLTSACAKKIRSHRRRSAPRNGDPLREAVVAEYRRMCRQLARIGLPQRGNSTPREYADQAAEVLGRESEAARIIRTLTDQFEQFRYGTADMPSDLPHLMRIMRKALRRALRTDHARGMGRKGFLRRSF